MDGQPSLSNVDNPIKSALNTHFTAEETEVR